MISVLSSFKVLVLLFCALIAFFSPVVAAENDPSAGTKASYARGQAIPVSCLNRTSYVVLSLKSELL